MNITVFIKQVPDTNDVVWTENNNIDRAKMESVINPADKQALEAALRLKDEGNAHITAVTMGPDKAIAVLQEAVAMGADDAFLLCDSKFAGSDTCATSKVLAAAVKEKLPETDIILFGQSAIDGETSQTGPSTAVRLDIPFITNVNEIFEIKDGKIIAASETEKEKNIYEIALPCAICINNYVFKPRLPRINGYINSQNYKYKSYNLYELNLDETQTGIKGSPTFVSRVYKNDEKRNCQFIDAENTKNIIQEIKKLAEN